MIIIPVKIKKLSIFNAYKTLAVFLMLLFSMVYYVPMLTVQAETYTSICVKGHVDMIEQQVPTTPEFRTYLNQVCSCQEKELLKAGLSQADFQIYSQEASDWVSGKKMEIAKIKVTPRINAINNSDPVKKKCGTVFN